MNRVLRSAHIHLCCIWARNMPAAQPGEARQLGRYLDEVQSRQPATSRRLRSLPEPSAMEHSAPGQPEARRLGSRLHCACLVRWRSVAMQSASGRPRRQRDIAYATGIGAGRYSDCTGAMRACLSQAGAGVLCRLGMGSPARVPPPVRAWPLGGGLSCGGGPCKPCQSTALEVRAGAIRLRIGLGRRTERCAQGAARSISSGWVAHCRPNLRGATPAGIQSGPASVRRRPNWEPRIARR